MRIDRIKPAENKSYKIHILVVGLILVLGALQIIFANRVATSGKILQKLETEAQVVETENHKLELDITRQSSLETLKEKASQMGFVEDLKIANLNSEKEVAQKF